MRQVLVHQQKMKDGVINKQGINSRNYISSYNLQRDDEITEKTLAKIKDLLELECTQLLKHIFSLVVLKVLASPRAKVLLAPNAHVGFPAPPEGGKGHDIDVKQRIIFTFE